MTKTILITGATDGLGRATAQKLANDGHRVIIHGRNAQKLQDTAAAIGAAGQVQADLSDLTAVARMADQIVADHPRIDVLINNAGVFKTQNPRTAEGHDVRFVVNTLADVLLTRRLMPVMSADARVIHLSSAAQSPVDLKALQGRVPLQDMPAYAQSKLAITLWSQHFADTSPDAPVQIAVNPGSLLATRMVREGFGTSGNDLNIGVDILTRAALSDEFAQASGRYFDNDAGRFGNRYPDAMAAEVAEVIDAMVDAV